MYIDRQRIIRAIDIVSHEARASAFVERVRDIQARSYSTEFFSEQDVLTLEKVELAEMGLNGVCA